MNSESLQVVLNVTHFCNLNCDYCYYSTMMNHKKGWMDETVLTEVFKKLSESSYNELHICLHGGEPLTQDLSYFNAIFNLHKKYLYSKKSTYSIQTNGTLINKEFAALVNAYSKEGFKIELGISIDGPETVHDQYRKAPDGTGSWGRIIDNLAMLDTYGIKYGVLSVLHDGTYDNLESTYGFFKDLKGIAGLDFIVPQYHKDKMPLQINRLSEIYISLFEKWFYDTSPKFDVRDFSALLSKMTGSHSQGVCWMVPECIKNIPLISIDVKGDVAPCDNYTHVTLGNIMEGDISDFMKKSKTRMAAAKMESDRSSKCTFCNWYKVCSGGCPLNISSEKKVSVYCEEYIKIYAHVHGLLAKHFNRNRENPSNEGVNPNVVKIFESNNKFLL